MELICKVAPATREVLDHIVRDDDEVERGLVHVEPLVIEGHASSSHIGHGHGYGQLGFAPTALPPPSHQVYSGAPPQAFRTRRVPGAGTSL